MSAICQKLSDAYGAPLLSPMRTMRSAGRPIILFQMSKASSSVVVDGDQQALGRQLPDLGQQLPGPGDGVLLEVVAERPVAQHLEEGVVARGVADLVEVVVLAAGAQAALHIGRAHVAALLGAQEHVLELDHARVGEQQGRVVARHQRRGRHDGVALAGEEFEEIAADIGGWSESWKWTCRRLGAGGCSEAPRCPQSADAEPSRQPNTPRLTGRRLGPSGSIQLERSGTLAPAAGRAADRVAVESAAQQEIRGLAPPRQVAGEILRRSGAAPAVARCPGQSSSPASANAANACAITSSSRPWVPSSARIRSGP